MPTPVTLRRYIGYFLYRTAMDSHAQLQFGVLTQLTTNLLRATHRCSHARKERQHHSVACRQTDKLTGSSAARNCEVLRKIAFTTEIISSARHPAALSDRRCL